MVTLARNSNGEGGEHKPPYRTPREDKERTCQSNDLKVVEVIIHGGNASLTRGDLFSWWVDSHQLSARMWGKCKLLQGAEIGVKIYGPPLYLFAFVKP